MGCFAGCPGGSAIHAEATEFTVAAFAPLLQLVATQFATYPTIHFSERITGISHVVVAFPTAQVDIQFSDHSSHAPAPVAASQVAYAILKPFPELGTDTNAIIPADGYAQERLVPWAVHPTLAFVYLQLEFALEESGDTGEYSETRATGYDVYRAVISITNKTMPALLQFLVETVQKDVRQEGRQRSALRRASGSGLHFAVHNDASFQVSTNRLQKDRIGNKFLHLFHQ